MAAFEYKALTSAGKTVKGIIEADTAKQVRQQLRDKSLMPISVETTSQSTRTDRGGKPMFRTNISTPDLALLTRQLSTLIGSGLTIEAALLAVAEQTDKAKVKRTVMAIRSKVVEGYSLAEGMREFPGVFDNLFCAMVAAGEKSGHLDQVLTRLADYAEQRQATRSQMTQALVYPALLTVFAIGIVAFLLASVVPKIVNQFTATGKSLPATTEFLLSLSEFINQYGMFVVLAILLMLLAGQRLLRNPQLRLRYDRNLLKFPFVGKLLLIANTARFARTMSILTSSSVPILDGMKIAGNVLDNRFLQQAVSGAADQVREGSSLRAALGATKVFPPMMLHMIASGEKSGQLEQMLARAADNQDNELSAIIKISLSLFTPLIVAIMAGMVTFIVMAILQPIMQMNSLVGL